MPMKSVAPFPFFVLLLVLLAVVAVRGEYGYDCYAYFYGGGCPYSKACHETCRPCYKGIGYVGTWCERPLPCVFTCICGFKDAAPCPPFDGCRPPIPPSSSAITNYTFTFNNVTTPLTFGV